MKKVKLKLYYEYKDKAVKGDKRFEHVMAIALDPVSNFKKGIIRCITKRTGNIQVKGYGDRSELYKIEKNKAGNFDIKEKLIIKDEKKIIDKLLPKGCDFIGLEDPDIWIDPKTNLMHIYFTIPFIDKKNNKNSKIHLGHAFGPNMDSLTMTEPVLKQDKIGKAKELSIAPINKKGFRYNLVESKKRENGISYSVVRQAIVKDMGKNWKFGKIIFHPKYHNISWIAGHASPGPLLSKNFLDIGNGKMVGFINGREANQKIGDKTKYGIFSVGLFVYDYEKGEIDWVSSKPLIRDSKAKIITFASQFIETKKGEGILYAHVDDSFVRAYTLKSKNIKPLIYNL